jgi:predicted HTH transcriptional regulator
MEVFQFYDDHLRVVINFNEKTNTSSFDYDINEREGTIIKFILLNGVIKTEDIRWVLSVQSSGARKILRSFEEKNIIESVENTFLKEYELAKK